MAVPTNPKLAKMQELANPKSTRLQKLISWKLAKTFQETSRKLRKKCNLYIKGHMNIIHKNF